MKCKDLWCEFEKLLEKRPKIVEWLQHERRYLPSMVVISRVELEKIARWVEEIDKEIALRKRDGN